MIAEDNKGEIKTGWVDKIVEKISLYKIDIKPGEFFGELEIINQWHRKEKVTAKEPSYVLYINQMTFMTTLSAYDKNFLQTYVDRWIKKKNQIPKQMRNDQML